MTKISKRLETITHFLDINDSLVDVGCDHGLLSIYLYENKIVHKVLASDINQKALNSAINNIRLRNLDIETILSDGIKDIDLEGINTLVISGMGTSTVLHILEDMDKLSNINKIIIQSNNDYEKLRKGMNDKGYYLEKEEYTFDKGKWYITCKFVKSSLKNDDIVIKYGYLNNREYYEYLINSYKKIYERIPEGRLEEKELYRKKIEELEKAILK